jgi:CHAD domain-containing protein
MKPRNQDAVAGQGPESPAAAGVAPSGLRPPRPPRRSRARPPGPSAPPTTIPPRRLGAYLAGVLRERWSRCRRELSRCRPAAAEGAVHDARVSIRRLLAAFEVLLGLLKHPRLRKARRRLKRTLKRLGPLRDAQVLLENTKGLLPRSPALDRFRDDLRTEIRDLLRDARRDIPRARLDRLERRIAKTAAALRGADVQTLLRALTRAADDAHARLAVRRRGINPDRPETLHRMRLAFKAYRYCLKIAGPARGRFDDTQRRSLDHIQTVLGEIQDLTVAEHRLLAYAKRRRLDLRATVESLRRRRRQRILDSLDRAGQALAFWTPTAPPERTARQEPVPHRSIP